MRHNITHILTNLLVVGLTVLCARTARGGDNGRTQSIAWKGSFQAAFELATAAKKPVFIAINMDGEAANDDLARNAYHDGDLVKLSTKCVCMVASPSQHDEVPGPNGDLVCSRFGAIRCADHIAVERAVRATFLKGQSSIVAPQHILAAPDRSPLEIREYVVSAAELSRMMSGAIDKVVFPAKAKKAEQARLLGLVKEAASGARSTAPVIALMDALLGWSSDVALEVVKARAPSSVKLQIVQQLAGRGAKAEPILVALLGDDYPRVREQVVVALGRVRSKETRELLMRRLVVERDSSVKKALTACLQVDESQ